MKRSRPIKQHNRTVFTVEKDISLLKSVLQHNPYQTDEKNWEVVLSEMKGKFKDFPQSLSIRTIRGRINLLIKQYKTEELQVKSGKEEKCSERGTLIAEVIAIIESLEIPINFQLGPEEESGIPNDEEVGNQFSEAEVMAAVAIASSAKPKSGIATNEKVDADKERDKVISNSDLAPSPKDNPLKTVKRAKLNFEDGLVQAKQAHEMEMEKQRLALEEKKQDHDFALGNRKLDVENVRLQLELKREERECKMLEVMEKIANKQV